MNEKILSRILAGSNKSDLFDTLTNNLSPSDLQSLLLEVYAKRSSQISPAFLLKNFTENGFVKPSATPVKRMQAFDRLAFALAEPDFEPVELSPLCPLGTCSAVATVHQHKIVSTSRNTEVVADCTNVMALECAIRRKALLKVNSKDYAKVSLCTSHRQVRTQPLPDPRFLPHFRIFGLCTAARDTGSFAFEISSLFSHLDFYLKLAAQPDSPFSFDKTEVLLTDLEDGKKSDVLFAEVMMPLQKIYPQVRFRLFPERKTARNYYIFASFQLNASNNKGIRFNLADGGFTDWTQQLLNNRKERMFISGIGSELICQHFWKDKNLC